MDLRPPLALLTGSDAFQVAVSPQVLREALVTLRAKFDRSVLARFYAFLGSLHTDVLEPSVALGIGIPASVPAKGHHVLRACVAGRVAICLTLDRRHLLTEAMRRWALTRGFRLLTPGEFLEWQRAERE